MLSLGCLYHLWYYPKIIKENMVTSQQRRTFISYSRVNKDFALKLAGELKSAGFSVWLDQLDIPTGSRWDNELERALEECQIFLLILTPAAIASENVKDEIGYAIDNRKRILPILLEDCNMPLRLRRFQYVDFTALSYDEGVEKSKQQLSSLINEVTVPARQISGELQAEKKQSAKEAAARIVMLRTGLDQFESGENIVVKASALLTQGKQFFQNKDWLEAAEIFRQVLTLIPDHADSKNLLSKAEAQIIQERESVRTEIEKSNKPDGEKLPLKESVQERPKHVGQTQTRLSRKAIGIGSLVLLVLIGVISTIVWLAGNNSSSITSIGMVQIPSGSYTLGVDTVVQIEGFWIDRYEVTNSRYAKFIGENGNESPVYWTVGDIPAGLREHPVAQITWDQAKDYCAWAGKRLPTEAEWEVAARGPFGWKYPWGNNPDLVRQETQSTLPVVSNPANRSYYGAYYMSGNVWEWVDDPYSETAENEHVMRGGGYGPLDVLTAAVSAPDDGPASEKVGFRCAASGENVTRQYDEGLALDDDFFSSNTNWPGVYEDKFLFDYHQIGFYHVEARESNKFVPAFYEHEAFSNFVLETGVFVDKANTDNQQGNFRYGLGVEGSDGQFYAFLISAKDQNWQVAEGTWADGAVIGDSSDLAVIKSGTEESIRGATEQQEDRLTVIANGTEILYYVNGNLVYVLAVEGHPKVKVGFVVETLDGVTRVHIHFNWVKLLNIDPFEN
jgi:formylglycine-generating enzyme required for sulfatase activity